MTACCTRSLVSRVIYLHLWPVGVWPVITLSDEYCMECIVAIYDSCTALYGGTRPTGHSPVSDSLLCTL